MILSLSFSFRLKTPSTKPKIATMDKSIFLNNPKIFSVDKNRLATYNIPKMKNIVLLPAKNSGMEIYAISQPLNFLLEDKPAIKYSNTYEVPIAAYLVSFISK